MRQKTAINLTTLALWAIARDPDACTFTDEDVKLLRYWRERRTS